MALYIKMRIDKSLQVMIDNKKEDYLITWSQCESQNIYIKPNDINIFRLSN